MKHLSKFLALVLAMAMCLVGCGTPEGDPTVCTTTTPQTSATHPSTIPQTNPTTIPATTAPVTPERPLGYKLGNRLPDFTVKTYDGQTLSLYELLQEKEMVLINIWASWCGPCQIEFPYLQDAYEMYQDRIEVLALSCEPSDHLDLISVFAQRLELTFPMGQDATHLLSKFNRNSIPTSVVIDRYGVICFIESGAITDVDSFVRLFEVFLGEEYTESRLLMSIPDPEPEDGGSNEE